VGESKIPLSVPTVFPVHVVEASASAVSLLVGIVFSLLLSFCVVFTSFLIIVAGVVVV